MTYAQIIEKRNTLMHTASTLALDKNANAETRVKVSTILAEADELSEQAKNAQRLEAHAEELRTSTRPPQGEIGTLTQDDREKRAFANYITGRLKPEDHEFLKPETRDLTVGSAGATTGGGVLVPIGYDSTLHTATKSIGEILSGVRTWNTDSGEGIRVSLTDPTSLRFALVAEMATVSETDPTLSGFNSYVDTLGFSTKVSNQLLQDSAFSVDQFLSETIASAWVATASEAIIRGNSSNFQSLVTGASVGYTAPTGDVATLTYSDLLNLYSSLDPSYLPGAAFWMNSKTWTALLGVVDAQSRPILTTDLQGNPFKSLFGLPIRISQALGNLAATNVPILLGDAAKSYTYRQAGPLVVRRATERYIEQNATGFFAFQRAGGYVTSQSTSPSMVKLVMAAS